MKKSGKILCVTIIFSVAVIVLALSNAQEMASVKVYKGQWIEDTKKIGDWWSVGYLQREVINNDNEN